MHPYRRCTYCAVNVQSEDLRYGSVALALRIRKRWRVREVMARASGRERATAAPAEPKRRVSVAE
jgi:hypothetical protein